MILDLIFVRHGQSCANALSHIKLGIELFYPDPELTQAGIDTSKALSPSIPNARRSSSAANFPGGDLVAETAPKAGQIRPGMLRLE